MRLRSLSAALVLLAFTTAAAGVDLTRVERRLVKEPAYCSQPKYCLLVFGPEAKTRVWLVQDGDTLYVDRKGDGDLTAPENKVRAEKQQDADEGYDFKIGDIRDGERVHKDLHVYVVKLDRLAEQDDDLKALLRKDPKARGYLLQVEVDMPGRKGTGVGGRVPQRGWYADVHGVLQFAGRPAEAPVLHFGGPWQVALFGRQQLRAGRDTDVVLGVGSPGVGPGSTTWIDFEGVIPADKYPTLDIIYTAGRPVDAPLQEHYELKQRC